MKELKNAGLHIAFLVALYVGSMMIKEGDVWLGSGFILFGYILCYAVRWIIEDLLKSKHESKDSPYIDNIVKLSEEYEETLDKLKKLKALGLVFDSTKFSSEKELRSFIELHMPIAIRPVGKTDKPLVQPFTSANARKICIDAIVESLIEK